MRERDRIRTNTDLRFPDDTASGQREREREREREKELKDGEKERMRRKVIEKYNFYYLLINHFFQKMKLQKRRNRERESYDRRKTNHGS